MRVDALIQCLNEIVNDRWKTDNGFNAGFQRELEKGMHRLFPGTYIVENPHITSKIHIWKKEYDILIDLLSKSGIGWDSTPHTIAVIDEAVWDAHKRADPHVKTMEHALDVMDFVNELLRGAKEEDVSTGKKVNVCAENAEQVPEILSLTCHLNLV
ncbi:hypothetical protein ACS0TY_018070 [Phlomoides rotata]